MENEAEAPATQWSDLPDVMTGPQVARMLKWSEQHLRAMRSKLVADPKGEASPPFMKLGRRTLRYQKRDVMDWLDRQRDRTIGADKPAPARAGHRGPPRRSRGGDA